MDTFTINRIAHIRQQEAHSAAQHHGEFHVRRLLRPVGVLLVAAGQRLLDAAQDTTQPPRLATHETLDTADQSC